MSGTSQSPGSADAKLMNKTAKEALPADAYTPPEALHVLPEIGIHTIATQLSYEEYHKLPADSHSYELVRGALHPVPAVTCRHQLYHSRLFHTLSNYIAVHRLGLVLSAPVEVLLERGPDTSLHPDVLFISKQRRAIFDPKGPVKGAPDMIFDILTHTAIASKDLRKEIFRLSGVREYWQISPHPQRVTVNLLSNLEFKATDYQLDEVAGSTILPGFTISLNELYAPAW